MFFTPQDEFIVNPDGTTKPVLGTVKEDLARGMNDNIRVVTARQGKYVRFKNGDVNVVEEALSRAPMFANAIVSRGYKNILFVGHYNDHQTHWMLDKFTDRFIDLLPPERKDMHSFPDMNIVAQFIPLVMHEFEYDVSFSYTRPSESKHKGCMHYLYDNSKMTDRSLMSSQQYKHGQSSLSIEGDHEKFDAVVFLGVPMQDSSVGFEEDQVREVFAPYCTPTFEMVDIYYGAPSEVKWVNGEEKDSYQNVQYAFDVRSSWDPSMNAGYPEEFNIMDRMFSVY